MTLAACTRIGAYPAKSSGRRLMGAGAWSHSRRAWNTVRMPTSVAPDGTEIYVRPYPDVNGGRWQVSTGGGRMPLWSRNGRELFYVSPDGAMMVSRVEAGRTWVAATPVQLFRGDYVIAGAVRTFDIA